MNIEEIHKRFSLEYLKIPAFSQALREFGVDNLFEKKKHCNPKKYSWKDKIKKT